MKNNLGFLAGWTIAAAVLGLVVCQLLAGFGFAFAVSEPILILSLVAAGVGITAATYPIARYRKTLEQPSSANKPARPNPFYAVRLLAFSRAVAITGLGFTGWHLGQLVWLWGFSIAPNGLVGPTLTGLASSLIMFVLGLVAENNCRAPKDLSGDD